LGQIQFPGSLGNVLLLGNRRENPKLLERHRPISPLTIRPDDRLVQ
jgi:hypothetical protein